jgi:hypothetical protein
VCSTVADRTVWLAAGRSWRFQVLLGSPCSSRGRSLSGDSSAFSTVVVVSLVRVMIERMVPCAIFAAAAMSRCASPSRAAAGDRLLVLGGGFAGPSRGSLDAAQQLAAQFAARAGIADLLGLRDRAERHASGDRRARCVHDGLVALADLGVVSVKLGSEALVGCVRKRLQFGRQRGFGGRLGWHCRTPPVSLSGVWRLSDWGALFTHRAALDARRTHASARACVPVGLR